jgi:hypothetical protein
LAPCGGGGGGGASMRAKLSGAYCFIFPSKSLVSVAIA